MFFKLNRKLLPFSFLICVTFWVQAQTFLPIAETAFETHPPFNTEYIKQQGIKSIVFDIIDKKDMQVAEDKGLLNYYEFNSTGKLSRFYYTSIAKVVQKEFHSEPVYKRGRKVSNGYSYTKNHYILDTVSTTFFYDSSNRLIIKRYKDDTFYETFYYTYFPDGKIQSEKRCKETNVAENKRDFKLGVQYMLSEESYTYTPTSKNQYKKICINSEGRPYKEIIFNQNDFKLPTQFNEQYLATWIKQESSFSYNFKGQLTQAIYKRNTNGDIEEKRTYEYGTNDCLLTEKHYRNNELKLEISYVTDSNKKLTSYIIRDAANKSLRIVKLIYEY